MFSQYFHINKQNGQKSNQQPRLLRKNVKKEINRQLQFIQFASDHTRMTDKLACQGCVCTAHTMCSEITMGVKSITITHYTTDADMSSE